MLIKILFSFLLLASIFANAEQPTYITFPSDVPWKSQDSDHFTAVFREGRENLAIKVLSAAEKAHKILCPIFPEGPEKTWIVVADFKDSLNGYALNFPYSHIVFFASPPAPGGQLANLDDWIYSVILHEYVHILHIYPASGVWKLMRTLFGSWVVPNGMMPSHLHEGLATFLETEKTFGGRGRGALFSMYRRMAVESGAWGNDFAPLDLFDGSSTRWPYGASPYFFGYELYHELWSKKGKQGIYELTDEYSSNLPYFINSPLEKVYQTDYPVLWDSIFEKTQKETQEENTKIKKLPLSKLNYLTSNGSYKGGLRLSPDKRKVAYVAETAHEVSGIYLLNLETKKKQKLTDMQDSAFHSLCWLKNQSSENIFYISALSKNGYSINGLYVWDFATNKSSLLHTEQGELKHIHRIECSQTENKVWAYIDENENGKILELTYSENTFPKTPILKLNREWKVPERQYVTSLLSKTSLWFTVKDQLVTHLYRWGAQDSPEKISSLPSEFFNLKGSAKEGILEAISDLSGRYEIWEIDTLNKKLKQKFRFLGGINSFDFNNNQYLVSSYQHGGFDIAWGSPIESEPISIPKIDSPSPLPEPDKNLKPVTDYSPWSTLRPHTWVPSLLFVPDGAQIGAWIPGFDLTQRHLFDLFGGYDTRGLPFANLAYTYRFSKSSAWLSGVNFSPSYLRITKSFFTRWGGKTGLSQDLPWGLPKASLSLVFNRLEPSVFGPAEQSVGLELALSKSWGFATRKQAISATNGIKTTLSHTQYLKSLGSTQNFFTSIASLSSYWENPLARNHVFFLGNKLGYTEGSSFINSFFEGGGELIFSQGRGLFLNRGFLPSLFAGRRMFSTNLEYRFPIKTIERGYELLPAYLHNISGSLVADTLSYDRGPSHPTFPKDIFKKFYTSCGIELKSQWKFIYYLPTEIRFGTYHGFGPFGENLYFSLGIEAGL
jgi:hypothetical protein